MCAYVCSLPKPEMCGLTLSGSGTEKGGKLKGREIFIYYLYLPGMSQILNVHMMFGYL
jgi:hypothetical protein